MPSSAQSMSNSCWPVAARLRSPKRRSVKALPLSVSTRVICIGAARSRSRRKRRAFGRGLRRVDAHEDPARRPVDGHEEVAAAVLVGHLGQILDVDVQVAGFVGLEGAVRGLGLLRFQRLQVAYPMPPQAAVEAPSGETCGIEELAHHGEQVIERQGERALRSATATASCAGVSVVCNRLRRVAPVVDIVATAATSTPSAPRSRNAPRPARPVRCSPGSQPGSFGVVVACLCREISMLQPPPEPHARIDLAMNKADRRGSM